jgi:hypothetical protein
MFRPLGHHQKDTYHIQHERKLLQNNIMGVHDGMARLQVADGGDDLQFWREAANILNKQPRTADKGWSSSLGVGRGVNNSP